MLTLIRCGETTWHEEQRVIGTTDLPLSDVGRESVQAAAATFKPGKATTVHHPSDEAATETASIFATASGLKTKAVAELADPHLGLLEGLTEQVFAERYPKRHKQWLDDPLTLSPPEGEDLAEARSRLFATVSRLVRRAKSPELVLVMHSVGLGLLRCWLADRPARDQQHLVADRPRVERYALTGPMIEWMDDAAAAVPSQA
jgi:broad specificity phosphatase PhoE